MKEYIQKNGDDVAIVIYDAPLPPKYFRLTKRFIKTFFIVTPLLLAISAFAIFSWGLGNRLKDSPALELPAVISEHDSKLIGLEAEVKSLKQSNAELAEKIASPTTTETAEDPFLMAIKKPYGMQNQLNEKKVTIDQLEFGQESNKTFLKFQIVSSTPETKVQGHVIVFMISEAGLLAYPHEANALLSEGIKYSIGEPFSVSRVRPTNADFLHRLNGATVKFVIYIFSREGDLLHIRETESFKVGAKQ